MSRLSAYLRCNPQTPPEKRASASTQRSSAARSPVEEGKSELKMNEDDDQIAI